MSPAPIRRLVLLATLYTLVACDTDSADLPLEPGTGIAAHRSSTRWSPWSEPVNLGAIVNSSAREINANLSRDGLSLYFVSNRPGGFGNNDIWGSRRASRHSPWEAPVNLGPVINTASDDGGASVSDDGHLLFFNSNRPGGHGNQDLYVSRRADRRDDLGWEAPVNLGPTVNTAEGERGPDYFSGNGTALLYFNRGPLLAQGSDLYVAPLSRSGEPVGPAELLADVSAPGANDAGQTVSTDGKEILFWSNRAGTQGFADIWVSTRRSVRDTWSLPTNPGARLNTEFAEERPHLSRDGGTLLFDSDRPGAVGGQGQDLWMSTRTRAGDADDDDDDDDDDGGEESEGDAPRFSDWSAPVNLGPVVNSPSGDLEVSISKNGLSLFISSSRSGDWDILVSQRAREDEPWGPPQTIGATVNTAAREQGPFLSPDGHRLYFFSDRPGGFGGLDLYVTRRRDKRDDFGWQPPENLGSGVNTPSNENLVVFFDDDGTESGTLYLTANRPGGMGGTDVYTSALQPDGTFGPAALVAELSSPVRDRIAAIRRDGLEIFVASDRPGTLGAFDLWVATRGRTSDPWAAPVNLGPVVNTAADESSASISFDGTTLYLESNRPGGLGDHDLWATTRTKRRHDSCWDQEDHDREGRRS